MSSGGAASIVTMKATAAFPQSNSQTQKQHSQNNLQPTNAFDQQIQLQQQQQHQHHLLQQQQQQLQHNQNQHSQLHRLSQPHLSSSLHPAQSIAQNVAGHPTHPSVFPNAEFFQTLQQTAAAALPTVLPYDQSQYIGQLMYFQYPTAAAAAANGLFSAAQSTDNHHMSVGSSAPGTQATIINQASCNAGQLLSGGIVSATPSGMMALNNAATTNQVNNANHLFASGAGLVGIGASGPNAVSVSNSASLAPLFTTAHFYPHHHAQQTGQQQQQLQIHHQLQQHHPHTSVHMQHVQSLAGHAGVHLQQQQSTAAAAATVLLPSSMSSASQISMLSSQQSHQPVHSTSQNHSNNNNCENLQKTDDKLQSTTPVHTPQKQTDQELLSQSTQLGTPQGNNSSLDASSTTVKRDNNGTGHFVCGVCGREFGMRCRLIAHTRRHTGERPFPCADCGRAFSDRGNLQRHRYTHSSQPRFHCTVCGKSFRQASCLSNHRRFHCAGATGRPCPFCQRSFRSSSSLQMHIRWKHRADAAAAVAAAAAAAAASGSSSLSEAFTHLPGLTSYVTTATVNGIPTMSLNGSDLQNETLMSSASLASNVNSSNVSSLMAPIISNSGGRMDSILGGTTNIGSPNKRKWRRKSKPKQAQNAFGKLTGDGLNLLAGINLSEGIDVNAAAAAAGAAAAAIGGPVPLDRKGRPCNYPCPACPRRFAFQCRLAAHLRCHTNIRPFICIDCGRAFTQRGYLVRHAAVHKLDRPFSCGLCDRSYKHYGSLVNHRRTHSKGGGGGGSASNLGNLNILSNLGTITSTNIGTLSSLEEVVSGALGQPHKTDSSDTLGRPTTITLLPVSKVEEILPGDLNGSVQQVCLPSGSNILTVSESQEQHDSEQVSSHQLTATAVWPILATGGINHVSQGQLIPSSVQQSRQAMVSGSHFSTITISPTQIAQSNQPTSQQQQHQLPLVTPTRPQLAVAQPTSTTMLTASVTCGGAAAPTFVTLPLFNGSTQNNNMTESDRSVNNNGQLTPHSHHQFRCSTSTLSDSSQQQHHLQIAQSAATLQQQHNQATTRGIDSNNTAPVLHVLQPSPSIFFSPYYLPHSAASQM
ncbi:Zinc finger and SCAN domain-containing protein [Schistosoma japonicum]|uniref:Zinc finger and SCAN domain-containing protein n=1 Tax=Schistosoma japonicum TaxID=6182 RepID=A0A4Z2D3E6_SCHJA|nr:Zinc finger and SCAN domain-containing protein [Schistosoma japonicum]